MKTVATLTLTLTLATGCQVAPPEVMDTHTGEWKPAPEGWQCDGQPCTPEQLQQLDEYLAPLETCLNSPEECPE